MTDQSPVRTQRGLVKPLAPGEAAVWTATGLSLLLTLVALVVGLSMAASRRVSPCANGTEFPEGAKDLNCYVHPQAGVGSAVAIFAIVLGIIVVLSAVSAAAALRTRAASF